VARETAWHDYLAEAKLGHDLVPVPRFRNTSPTIKELTDLYEAKISQTGKTSPSTARSNVRALHRFVGRAFPGEKVENVRASQLNESAVSNFRSSHYTDQNLPAEEGFRNKRLNTTINSEFRQARSVFSAKAKKIYAKASLILPKNIDSDFLKTEWLEERHPGFQRIPQEVDEKMKVEAVELAQTNPSVALVYELARYGGLRSEEILQARWHWLEGPYSGKTGMEYWEIAICYRDGRNDPAGEDYRPKSRHRRVALSAERVENWKAWAPPQKDTDFIIAPNLAPTSRANLVQREASKWIRQFLPDRTKSLHELRKQAGSEVADRDGILAAAKFLGDRPEVAMRHYQDSLKKVGPL